MSIKLNRGIGSGTGYYRLVRSLHIFKTIPAAGSYTCDACGLELSGGNDGHAGRLRWEELCWYLQGQDEAQQVVIVCRSSGLSIEQ